ncbi:MAG: TfoX/Sxy family protein [Pseudomonadota bacterium]
MAVSKGYRAFVIDSLSAVGPVTIRAMFGGAGVYADDVMFGLIADEELYLKADADSASRFEAEGCGPFVYAGKSKTTTMSYWRVPERLFDDTDELAEWARTALALAQRQKASSPKAKRKRSK